MTKRLLLFFLLIIPFLSDAQVYLMNNSTVNTCGGTFYDAGGSAGNYAILQNLEAGYALLKMPSGEIRRVKEAALASIGQVANSDWMNVRIGKAGRSRHMGWRPSVRGKVMNPVDHPHGGGEGHNPIGMKYPKTPWGKHALGVKTRSKKKYSNTMIVQRRTK